MCWVNFFSAANAKGKHCIVFSFYLCTNSAHSLPILRMLAAFPILCMLSASNTSHGNTAACQYCTCHCACQYCACQILRMRILNAMRRQNSCTYFHYKKVYAIITQTFGPGTHAHQNSQEKLGILKLLHITRPWRPWRAV